MSRRETSETVPSAVPVPESDEVVFAHGRKQPVVGQGGVPNLRAGDHGDVIVVAGNPVAVGRHTSFVTMTAERAVQNQKFL